MAVDWRALIGAKTADQVIADFWTRMAELGSSITNFSEGGPYRTLSELTGEAIEGLYNVFVAVVPHGFRRHAAGIWLDLHGDDMSLPRNPAVKCRQCVVYAREGTAGNLVVPAAAVVRTQLSPAGTRLEYLVVAETILPDGQSSVPVLCEAAATGVAYNLAPGQVLEMVTHVDGISSVTSGDISRAGVDAEGDEAYRERQVLAWAAAADGDTSTKFKAWARSVPGVVDAEVDDDWPRGQATFDCIITGTSGTPTEEMIATVQALLDSRRNINDDVLVRGPRLKKVGLHVIAYLPEDGGDEAAIEAALTAHYTSRLSTGALATAPRLRLGRPYYLARMTQEGLGVEPILENIEVVVPADDQLAELDELLDLEGEVQVTIDRLEAEP
ncbi:MAG: baseplate J/gp47 family protein [Deltaproteobacteria bacterium]|nr:baseplate J/gp47 family protein [Deltaproteobacteria bacterium]